MRSRRRKLGRTVFSSRVSPFPRSRIEEAFMTGYRFMARLRHYYTVHWPFAADKDGDRGGREESEMQAASRRIWFSASRKRSSLGGD